MTPPVRAAHVAMKPANEAAQTEKAANDGQSAAAERREPAHTYMHIYIHTYIHTYTYIHVHRRACVGVWGQCCVLPMGTSGSCLVLYHSFCVKEGGGFS